MYDQCSKCHNNICTRKVPIFAGLAAEEIQEVTELIIRTSYGKGEMIIGEDDQLNQLIILNSGMAKGYRYNIDGKEQILHLFSQGDFFGETNLLRSNKATYNLIALSEVNICAINKEDFQNLVKKFPLIGFKVMEVLSERLDRLEHQVEAMGTGTVEDRIAHTLVEFAYKFGSSNDGVWEITLPLNREGIASYIGLTRETVSRTLNLFQDQGLIKLQGNKKILIENLEKLI